MLFRSGFAFVEMADEAIEATAIDGLQGTELMGRPLRINKAEPRVSGGPRRGGRGGYGGNNGGYGGNNSGYGGNNGGYGGGNSESNTSYTNKSSGAEGWEDRSYGNSSENSEYESGRSRRKRGVSNRGNATNDEN